MFAALLCFIVGLQMIVDPKFPEKTGGVLEWSLITWISIYLMVASVLIIVVLCSNRDTCKAFTLFGGMYGWFFISSASLAMTLFYIASFIWYESQVLSFTFIITIVWCAMFIASLILSYDLRSQIMRCKQ
jgi:preprotein translocase subunit SecG